MTIDLILEYSKHPDINENVAVIMCGRQTKFLRHYSNQYQDIIRCLGIFSSYLDHFCNKTE